MVKRHGVCEQCIDGWCKQFAGMAVDDVNELKSLAQERARLGKLLAERDLVIEILKEITRTRLTSLRQHYSTIRRHSSLQYETIEAFNSKQPKHLLTRATKN